MLHGQKKIKYIIYVCVSTLYDVRNTTKSPNEAFLRTHPRLNASPIYSKPVGYRWFVAMFTISKKKTVDRVDKVNDYNWNKSFGGRNV